MLYRIWKLTIKELIQLARDRLMAPFVLLGPLTELLMVAWSTSQGIEHLPTAVLDLDRSAASRGLIAAMVNTETFAPYAVETMDQITADIDGGRALAAWVIPRGFEANCWMRARTLRRCSSSWTAPTPCRHKRPPRWRKALSPAMDNRSPYSRSPGADASCRWR